ncbi:thiamine phosphate synthase [Aliarcobacter trophiarum LMG 25534]|uniref:Thiamine phosphate synthase n=1 Tax=Aliarcobacter trophiarum LMG 25534 TaxID=1032241 RepID=A0ABY0EXA6_9BACT|nr:thiamine phosphate synthase [Aliarcobacter trophiarum]RXJ92320.1 thiamine phosphate synthase [Aliarcobacter trophiarum LMG 25534]
MKSYLISDPNYFSNNPEEFKKKLKEVLKNHKIDFACFRDKSSQNIEELANIFLQTCKKFKVKNVLINSNITLAITLKFDGVHLNSQQFDKIKSAKKSNLLTIISCHTLKELENAMQENIDFVTYSPIFDTPNKGEAKGTEKLKEAIKSFPNLKIIALGGIITNEQIQEIEEANAYGFASIRYFI